MPKLLLKFRAWPTAFAHDLVMIPLAWIGAYWLRFNLSEIPQPFLGAVVRTLPWVIVVQGTVFWWFGLYRGVWRFASVPDLLRILQASLTGAVATGSVLFIAGHLEYVPRSAFVLDVLLLVFLLGGPRFAYRFLKDRRLYGSHSKKAVIMGAGLAGERLMRDLLRAHPPVYRPVAFVDDDRGRIGKEIHGVPVAADCEHVAAVARRFGADMILIAIRNATARDMQRLIGLCEQSHLPFRILPRRDELADGDVNAKALREVHIEDLLGRESVRLDWGAITAGVRGKSVLVTGGGGSIGAELCRQIARLDPACLVIFERSEYALYAIELELRARFPRLALHAVLGDVCDRVSVEDALKRFRPDAIFHAAAYKHVPMLEGQVRAAVQNNVLGTALVARAAAEAGCAAFVLISSDKAVNPSNVMGTTKRVAEMCCRNLSGNGTRFITVRFGNVMGSAGSVIPLFQRQIAAGGPVTVTHPEITRYFMTIPEACQLILQASVIGEGGEIFVLDMGEPVRITYLAEQMIALAGKKPGIDIEITYTGLRPGEKLYEELFHANEKTAPTRHPKIRRADSRTIDAAAFVAALRDLEKACADNDEAALRALLQHLVPERVAPKVLPLARGKKGSGTV